VSNLQRQELLQSIKETEERVSKDSTKHMKLVESNIDPIVKSMESNNKLMESHTKLLESKLDTKLATTQNIQLAKID
jgi:hypothetical protein